MPEAVLIAGCGDLGQRAASRLLAGNVPVYGLRRHPPASTLAGLRWLRGDVTQVDTLPTLPDDVRTLLYVLTPGERSAQAYRAVFQTGLQNLVRHAGSALKRVVFVSSTAVYGEHHGDWVDENTPTSPLGDNGVILGEAEAWLMAQPLEAVALRLAGLYGPGRNQLFQRIRQGLARAPRQPIHWANRIHIDDAAAALEHLVHLADPASVYIGCDDTPTPLHELYQFLADRLHAPPIPEGPPPQGVGSKRLRNARLRASGLTLRWPDTRQGYDALLGRTPS